MNLFTLAIAYLRSRMLASVLQVLLLAVGLAAIVVMLLVTTQIGERVERDTRGIDLVVGAKGSPLQLVLSAVFHVDTPTGNIPYADGIALRKHPLVRQAIPLALGDSWRGYRIVGTEPALVAHYGAQLAQGRLWEGEMQAVVGALAARSSGADGGPLKLGDSLVGAHGLAEGGEVHDKHPYEVVGILAPTGGVLDRLVLVSVESVWDVHSHEDDHERGKPEAGPATAGPAAVSAAQAPSAQADAKGHRHGHDHGPRASDAKEGQAAKTAPPQQHRHGHGRRHAHDPDDRPARGQVGIPSGSQVERQGAGQAASQVSGAAGDRPAAPASAVSGAGGDAHASDREITAMLVRYASPLAAAQLPRLINAQSALQAASPAVESARLTRLVGVGVDTLRIFAWVLLVAAGLALFISLYGALSERAGDLAMLRVLGARRGQLLMLLLIEGMLLCVAGAAIGLLLGHAVTEVLGARVPALSEWALTGWAWAPGEGWLIGLAVLIGGIAAMLPAVLAYRTDIAKVLAKG